MKISKKIRFICILTVLLSALSIVFFYKCGKKETVIEFAMFNGSNWGVAVQESYSVIDKAIEKFEGEEKKEIAKLFLSDLKNDKKPSKKTKEKIKKLEEIINS